jgi:hypothetical protein
VIASPQFQFRHGALFALPSSLGSNQCNERLFWREVLYGGRFPSFVRVFHSSETTLAALMYQILLEKVRKATPFSYGALFFPLLDRRDSFIPSTVAWTGQQPNWHRCTPPATQNTLAAPETCNQHHHQQKKRL